MNRLPTAEITMVGGAAIVAELFPEDTPNTVNSFIWIANNGWYDDYAIQRVEPNMVVDVSFNALGRRECQYCIENEAANSAKIRSQSIELGALCMGGYDDLHISGGEFFLPLVRIDRWQGHFPIFGRIISGMEEVIRLGNVPVCPTEYQPVKGYIMRGPADPQIIRRIRVACHGVSYPQPVRIEDAFVPDGWRL